MARKSNQKLIEEFRDLLTNGARQKLGEELLPATKAYRAALWKAFEEIEDRLDPLGAISKAKARGEEIDES